MPDHRIKFNADQVLMYRLRQKALHENRTLSDVARRACEAGLGQVEAIPGDAAIETMRGGGYKPVVTAAYLSGALAAAVKQLADDTDRSTSYVMRDLIRSELKRRGLLPSPALAIDTAPAANPDI